MSAARLMAAATGDDLAAHLALCGPPPLTGPVKPGRVGPLADQLGAAGLRGRGGGWFPTSRKLTAVAAATGSRSPVVVVNGMEGEPLSGKDAHLLTVAPHLVMDGAQLAAEAVGARRIVLAVPTARKAAARLRRLAADRRGRDLDPVQITVAEGPDRYLAGQESALASWVGGGRPLPTTSRPFESGVDGRATMLSNAETYAHLALIARHGASWFRAVGTGDAPGTTLITVTGCVARPGVVEVPVGTPLGAVLRAAGGLTAPPSAVLCGGYGGAWLSAEAARNLPLAPEAMKDAGATLGPGIISVLPASRCGLADTATVARWLAEQGAQQCGPCMFGLPAIAQDLDDLARLVAPDEALERLRRRLGVLPRRGACAHPDGAVRLLDSALSVFAEDVAAHLSGYCHQTDVPAKVG